MRIAIPLANGKLSLHFGHCQEYALFDIDEQSKEIIKTDTVEAPPHVPGLLPKWLHEKGANLIIAGGMGARAMNLFAERSIAVVVGAPSKEPGELVASYLSGTLECGGNVCDH